VGRTTIAPVTDMLGLSEHLPVIELEPGQALVREGGRTADIWVLVSGSLQVLKGDVPVNVIRRPGAVVGEISVLLDTESNATVVAMEPSRLRHAVDGRALLLDNPEVTRFLAIGLAERLNFVTSYLADLQEQYGEAPGLSMVPDVLSRLTEQRDGAARPGSARDPDPEY
jgi:CRP/FNR family cyclic AMP-dependent transcriptional regulator